MTVELDAGRTNQFPTVIWLDGDKRSNAINLVFGTRIEGARGRSSNFAYVGPMGKSQVPRRWPEASSALTRGTHWAADVVAKAQAVLSESELLRAMFDVGHFSPNTPLD
jgi:hypothetical protein